MASKPLFSHLKLHFIVLIYGFTAILGKLISISAVNLVWYRMLIAGVALFIFLKIRKRPLRLPRKDMLRIVLIGLVVAAHWISFFGAIKLSNISVTLGCLASATLFTSILEPLFFKKKLDKVEVLIGVLIIVGLYLIFQFELHYWKGILAALLTAFLAGLFTVLNKKEVARFPARVISFYEMLGGWLGISLFILLQGKESHILQALPTDDIIYLLILGILCTAFAFVIQVDVMRQLTAYVVNLAINLEPVYGILLAYFIFGESELMSMGFYIGTVVILLSVFGFPVYTRWKRKREHREDGTIVNM